MSVRSVEAQPYERDAAFVGAARIRLRKGSDRSWTRLAVEVSECAVRDAGLAWEQIDGVCVHAGSAGLPGLSAEGVRGLLQATGLRPIWHSGATESPGLTGSLLPALLAVSAGLCAHVLCVDVRTRESPRPWLAGAQAAAADLVASGRPAREALGWVAVAAGRHAERDGDGPPGRGPTMDEYLCAETPWPPFGRFDLAPSTRGATALVVSSASLVGSNQRPVWIDSVGTAAPDGAADGGHIGGPAAHLWRRASVAPDDVDLAVVDDRCTFDVLAQIEALRLCPPEGVAEFVRDAVRIGPGGELPVNPDGGQLASGHPGGYSQLYEAVTQLRGEAGRRQVPGAEVAAVSSLDRSGSGMATLLSAQRFRRRAATANKRG
jgi:acetyl-CoA acetyltransferase